MRLSRYFLTATRETPCTAISKIGAHHTFEIQQCTILVGAHVWWKEELGDTYGEITKSIKQSYDHRTAPPGAVLTVRARDPRLCMTQIQKHMTDCE